MKPYPGALIHDAVIPGAWLDVPAAAYHASKGHASKSILWPFRKSPAHGKHKIDEGTERTPAMLFGSVLHHQLLTPKDAPDYVIAPEGFDGRTKEGKAWKAEQTKDVISFDDFLRAGLCAEALHLNKDYLLSIEDGHAEVSLFHQYEFSAIPVKARVDWVPETLSYLADVKTCQSAAPADVTKVAWNYGYWLQALIYLDLWNAIHPDDYREIFKFHFVESEPPFGTSSVYYELGSPIMDFAQNEFVRLLKLYEHCLNADDWPSYNTDPIRIDAPGWAWKEIAA